MSLIPEHFLNAVASIGVQRDGNIQWIGTGFFVQKEVEDGKFLDFLITNKHVIANQSAVIIRMKHTESATLIPISLNPALDGSVFFHPDLKVDIAAILLNGDYIRQNQLDYSAFDIDRNILTTSELKNRGFDYGSGVFMLGYPLGLVDINSNSPICRKGCVARFDLNEINSMKSILLDIQNFPGNSGGPIISAPESVSIEGTPSLNQSMLIGIIHSYIPFQDDLLSRQTGKIVEIRTENSGLALANPAEYIRETIAPVLSAYEKAITEAKNNAEQVEEANATHEI